MTYDEYKKGFDKILANPDTALTKISPILEALKTDLDTLESTQGEVEALNGRIRDLQDTNIKLFLSQGGKGKDDEDEIDENVLSAYLTWSVVSVNKLATLNNVCLYFSVTQEQFYEFMNKYKLAEYL